MNMDFKERATQVYLDNVKRKVPEINDYELILLENAFKTGFNLGDPNYKNEEEKELALKLLSL